MFLIEGECACICKKMSKAQVSGGRRREVRREGPAELHYHRLLIYSFILRAHCLGHVGIHLETG